MLKIRRLFLIFMFLCAAFSSSASIRRDSLLVKAACLEREVFSACCPMDANSALLMKSEILSEVGEYSKALECLNRIRLFGLSYQERQELNIKKAYLAYILEDYDASLSYLEEIGMELGYVEPKLKKDWAALALSFFMPAGFLYVEAPFIDAFVYTTMTAASIGWIVLQLSSGCYVSGLLGGAMALNVSFLGGQEKVASLLEKRNSDNIKSAKKEALSSFFQASSEGRIAHLE